MLVLLRVCIQLQLQLLQQRQKLRALRVPASRTGAVRGVVAATCARLVLPTDRLCSSQQRLELLHPRLPLAPLLL